MARRAYEPERTCLGCGRKDKQARLIRVAVSREGALKVDRFSGRGGYLHSARGCWEDFVKRKSHFRAFRADISRSAREKLIEELSEKYRE
ncbi:MAG TPA: DUF448 domain-containing protein [Candidatus Eisenbacteria bacterium]|nr:DUF448 domain-containing protein [Candidatus Eisenbacteria bacterium]